jgi:aminomethyltransferase
LLPADLAILKDGRLRYSLLLAPDGGIIDDLMVTRRGDHFYMVVNGPPSRRHRAYARDSCAGVCSIT